MNYLWVETGDWVTIAQSRRNSDHKPMILQCSKLRWGPKPFKFFNVWLEDKSLLQLLSSKWDTSKIINLNAKFKFLRETTKEWNKKDFGNINRRIALVEGEQDRADSLDLDKNAKLEIRSKLDDLYRVKANMLCQSARLNWQLSGEKNTKFFSQSYCS